MLNRVSWEIVIWIYVTFDNNFETQNDFAKYLKRRVVGIIRQRERQRVSVQEPRGLPDVGYNQLLLQKHLKTRVI